MQLWRHARDPLPEIPVGPAARTTGWQGFLRALLLQLGNPKIMVFFGSIFLSLLPQNLPVWMDAAVLAIVALNEFTWFALLALLFSGGPARAFYRRAKFWLDRFMGGALALLGLRRFRHLLDQPASGRDDLRFDFGEVGRRLGQHELRLGAVQQVQRIAALAIRHLDEERAGRAAAPAIAEVGPPGAGIAQAELDERLAARVAGGIDAPLAPEDPAFTHQPGEVPAVRRRVVDLSGPAAAGPQPGLVAHAALRRVGGGVVDGGLDPRHRHGRAGRRRRIGVVDAGAQGLCGGQKREKTADRRHGIEAGLCGPGCLVSPCLQERQTARRGMAQCVSTTIATPM